MTKHMVIIMMRTGNLHTNMAVVRDMAAGRDAPRDANTHPLAKLLKMVGTAASAAMVDLLGHQRSLRLTTVSGNQRFASTSLTSMTL